MISIINYGMGNVGSITNMLKKIGVKSILVNNPQDLERAQKIILPGVGAFDNAMLLLEKLELISVIKNKAKSQTPILGICLGMQLLGTKSEEGTLSGLDLIPGIIKRFPSHNNLKIPHMGWNQVTAEDRGIFSKLIDNKFYFVHSYYFKPDNLQNIIGSTNYDFEFASCICRDNVFGVQFHPEKSHKYGMQLLKNFSEI